MRRYRDSSSLLGGSVPIKADPISGLEMGHFRIRIPGHISGVAGSYLVISGVISG